MNSANAAIDARAPASDAPGAKQAGSNPLNPMGTMRRAAATAMTSRASRSNTTNRCGSSKFAVIESVVITFLLLFVANFVLSMVYLQVVPPKGG